MTSCVEGARCIQEKDYWNQIYVHDKKIVSGYFSTQGKTDIAQINDNEIIRN